MSVEDVAEIVMQLLGLSHRADTIVGNDMIRGVSGGEKRRVTVCRFFFLFFFLFSPFSLFFFIYLFIFLFIFFFSIFDLLIFRLELN